MRLAIAELSRSWPNAGPTLGLELAPRSNRAQCKSPTTDHGIAVKDRTPHRSTRRTARGARGLGATRASGRARLAAARLRARGRDPVSRRLMGGRLAVRRRAAVRIAGVILFALGVGAALSPLVRLRRPERATCWRGSIATRRSITVPPPRSPTAWPTTTAIRARRPFGRPIGRGSSAKSTPSASRPPSPGMAERDPYALRFGVALLAFATAVVAGPEMYGRFAAAFDWRSDDSLSPPWRRAASTRGSTRRPMPASRRLVIDFKTADPQTRDRPGRFGSGGARRSRRCRDPRRWSDHAVGTEKRNAGGRRVRREIHSPAKRRRRERRAVRTPVRPKSGGRSMGPARRRSCAAADPWRSPSSPSPRPAIRRLSRPRTRAPTSAAR